MQPIKHLRSPYGLYTYNTISTVKNCRSIKQTPRYNRVVAWVTLVLGVALLGIGIFWLLNQHSEIEFYNTLKETLTISNRSTSDTEQNPICSWLGEHPEATAWLSIENTEIDYPVAQANSDDTDFYLSHNIQGEENSVGSIYIDAHTNRSAQYVLVYGHKVGLSGGMFSSLRTKYRQDEFETLGNLYWTTDAETFVYRPLCAANIDMDNQLVQDFEPKSQDDFITWLNEILEISSAQASDASECVTQAQRAIALVTCSALRSGQRGRSVVVFVL